MKNVLITGFGFIGSNLIKYLFAKHENIKIDCVHNNTYADNFNFAPKDKLSNGQLTLIQLDLSDEQQYYKLQNRQYDYIFDLKACSHVDKSIENPSLFYKTNVYGTSLLLDWIKETQNNLNSILVSNTDEIFGSIRFDENRSFLTEDKFNPTSPYSASKTGQYYTAQAMYKTFGLPIVHTSSSNIYGPSQDSTKLIPKVIKSLITGECFTLYNNGINKRDWLSVEDHCNGLVLAATSGKFGELYGLGTNIATSNIEVIRKLEEISGKKLNIKHVEDRLAHDEVYKMDYRYSFSQLGWYPNKKFEYGLFETYKWYNNNQWALGL